MKLFRYLFCVVMFMCFLIPVLKLGGIEVSALKNLFGAFFYERLFFGYIGGNIILSLWILFCSKFKKKEKEHYVFMMFSLPLYNIYLILKKL
ncbi:MAG: hypothetical protein H3C39_02380 [Flavobacteriia bacterium]|nr:hypothetical protein [Flavobacteriia bacterium]